MDLARLADRRSLEFHRAVALRLQAEPALVEKARRRVRDWQQKETVHPFYRDAWTRILSIPVAELCAAIVEETEQASALRHVTPFAGFLDARTRWNIWRATRTRISALP